MIRPDALPRGLNFEDNRWLAHTHGEETGYCAQCGEEDKARVLAYNKVHSGHAVCYRCLRQLRNGHTDTTSDDLEVGERTGTMPWEREAQRQSDAEVDASLPF